MEHVENGSKGVESRFISCCKTLSGLEKLASITNKSNGYRGVVRIDITKLNPGEVNVLDLTNESVRRKHITRTSKALRRSYWNQNHAFQETVSKNRNC